MLTQTLRIDFPLYEINRLVGAATYSPPPTDWPKGMRDDYVIRCVQTFLIDPIIDWCEEQTYSATLQGVSHVRRLAECQRGRLGEVSEDYWLGLTIRCVPTVAMELRRRWEGVNACRII